MTGKKVPRDYKTYLTGAELKEDFMKAEPALSLIQTNGNNHKRLEALEVKNTQLETTLKTLTEMTIPDFQSRLQREKSLQENTEKAFDQSVDRLIKRIEDLEHELAEAKTLPAGLDRWMKEKEKETLG